VAVVTGGSAGLGLAIVEALASRGSFVAAVARDAARLEGALRRLDAPARDRVAAMPGDVGDPEGASSIVGRVLDRYSRIDTLVNCAGASPLEHRPMTSVHPVDWQRMLTTNLTGIFLMCRAALPHIAASAHGYVVNILSTVAHQPAPGATLYAATKEGGLGLTTSLIEEYRGTSLRISSVSPGKMDTSVWDRMAEPPSATERAAMMDPADVAEIVAWLIERPPHVHIPHITVRPWPFQT
jgi:NADP-dependent 3-hydroxy acid dehydrogenase YdfG